MATTVGSLMAPMGGPVGIGLSLLSGFFGPKQKLSPEQAFQMKMARQLGDFSESAPMTDPGERAALAQQQAMLGEQMRQQQGQAYGAYTRANQGNVGDFMQNLGNQQTGFRMALDSQHLMQAMQARRQAKSQAAGIAQGVGPRQETGGGLGEIFGNVARMAAYNKSRQPAPVNVNGRGELGGSDPRANGVQGALPSANPFSLEGFNHLQAPSGMESFFGGSANNNIPQPRSMMLGQPGGMSLDMPGFTFGKQRR